MALWHAQRQPGASDAHPGDYLCWYLAHFVDPKDVRFSEWTTAAVPDREHVTGKVLLLTASQAVLVEFRGVHRTEPSHDPSASWGEMDVDVHPLDTVHSVQLRTVSLDPDNLMIEGGAIKVIADTWSVDLPFANRYGDGLDYYQVVRVAALP